MFSLNFSYKCSIASRTLQKTGRNKKQKSLCIFKIKINFLTTKYYQNSHHHLFLMTAAFALQVITKIIAEYFLLSVSTPIYSHQSLLYKTKYQQLFRGTYS